MWSVDKWKLLLSKLLECAVLGEKGLNNVLPRSFRVEVTMHYGITIDFSSSNAMATPRGGGGGVGGGLRYVMTSTIKPMFWKNVCLVSSL